MNKIPGSFPERIYCLLKEKGILQVMIIIECVLLVT